MNDTPKTPRTTYTVQDDELLLGFYKKLLWDRMLPRIPATITPNTLTITGQICGVLAALSTGLAVSGYPFFFIISSVLLFIYLTFDNIDGPHARRTGQTSPLGEFLDHGLDGLTSTSVLIMLGLILNLDETWLVTLCTLGAFGFVTVFWEQFRTGLLVLPRFSSTEAVTFIVLYQIARFFMPAEWLIFSTEKVTAGTVVVAIAFTGYFLAGIPSVLRGVKKGSPAWELLPVIVLMSTHMVFSLFKASPLIPGIAVGILGANIVCRLIIMRHRGEAEPFLDRFLWLSMLPLLPLALFPNLWTATGWAVVSLSIIGIDYARNFRVGTIELVRAARPHSA